MGIVLADPHLPSFFVPLASATPTYEYSLAGHAPHKLNGGDKAWHRIMSNRQ